MNLTERAILVALKVSLPTATRRDKAATQDVETVRNARDLGRFNKDLINKTFLAKIKSTESAARAYLYAMTVPWGDDDSRLLAIRRNMEFSQKMQTYGAEFDAQAIAIQKNWLTIVAEAQGRLKTLFDATQYPHIDVLPSKFNFRILYTPVPTGGDLRVSLDTQQLKEMKARIDEDARAALQATAGVAWRRLYEEVAHMAARLAIPKGRLHDTVVTNLANVCDILPDLNFTDDPKLNKAIALVKKQLLVSPETLRSQPDVKENTAIAAKKIADAIGGWMVRT